MKKIIRGINTLIILVAAAATMYGQINLSGKKIHELPALPSNVVDTNYLFIIANPIDGKPYKFKKSTLLSGATGVVDGNYGDVTVSGVTWSINASSVQNSKMAAMANNTFKGNLSGSTAVPQDLTVGQMQSSLGINTKLNATDTASLSNRINSKMTAADTAYLSNRINTKQDLDADLTSISGASGTNTIYYRSAANTWSPVTIGGNMTFSGGTLNSTGGGGGGGTWGSITGTIGSQTDLAYELSQKQAQLVSSSNIKTINNISLLGSGNISVGGGGSQTLDQTLAVGNTTDTSLFITSQSAKLIIGDDTIANPSAIVDIISTTQGLLPPRMTTTQRNAISTPAEGLHIHNTTTHKPSYFNGTSWIDYNSNVFREGSISVYDATGTVGSIIESLKDVDYSGIKDVTLFQGVSTDLLYFGGYASINFGGATLTNLTLGNISTGSITSSSTVTATTVDAVNLNVKSGSVFAHMEVQTGSNALAWYGNTTNLDKLWVYGFKNVQLHETDNFYIKDKLRIYTDVNYSYIMGVSDLSTVIGYNSSNRVYNVYAKQYYINTGASNPTTSDIESGNFAVWKNTTNGETYMYINDGGTMKRSAIFSTF